MTSPQNTGGDEGGSGDPPGMHVHGGSSPVVKTRRSGARIMNSFIVCTQQGCVPAYRGGTLVCNGGHTSAAYIGFVCTVCLRFGVRRFQRG